MKHYLILVALVFTFFSCNRNDDTNQGAQLNIPDTFVGVWLTEVPEGQEYIKYTVTSNRVVEETNFSYILPFGEFLVTDFTSEYPSGSYTITEEIEDTTYKAIFSEGDEVVRQFGFIKINDTIITCMAPGYSGSILKKQ